MRIKKCVTFSSQRKFYYYTAAALLQLEICLPMF